MARLAPARRAPHRAALGLILLAPACAGRAVAPDADALAEARESAVRGQQRLYAELLALEADDLDGLVAAENRIRSEARAKIRAIAEPGAAAAEQAIAARPDDPAGHVYLALNLGLLALVKSRAAALIDGLPTRIRRAYEEALRLDPAFEAGGAYRFKGRFLATAPWPIGDPEAGRAALERANAIHPDPLNHLFLGDLHHSEGRSEEAKAAWRRALAATPHASTRALAPSVRALARRRLTLAD